MNLKAMFEKIKDAFSNAICINAIESINQNGLYLVFDGCENISPAKDKAKFALVLAANSLEADNFAALGELEAIRTKLFKQAANNGENWYKQIKAAKYEGSTLYLYAVLFEVEIDIF
ncbi:hypothetical protein [Campylobacter sp. FOBRC14]|uniref:hypothetical protein n=2 Tax=Campylobacter TaxID=194 RepID=UPI00027A3650|nr:hypothetical protein [Campylobacter sp. FOBRC14]EJP75818.1 hypothetical protein HMPREF1139_2016 [Campylobacter sp. FOBRC14]